MNLRRLTEADAELYRTLRLEGLQTSPTAFGSSYEESVQRPLSDYADRLRPTERTAVFGAFDAGRLVGTAGLMREPGLKERHKAMLWGMYVTPSARRKGVATALVTEVIAAARAMDGVLQIRLAVEGSNTPAVGLYQALGFQAFGHEVRALFVNGLFYDEVYMVLFLDAS